MADWAPEAPVLDEELTGAFYEPYMSRQMMINLVFGIIFPIIFGVVTQRIRRRPSRHFPGKRILLVTAHPDDEAMFFGPALLCRKWGQSVHLLCLSTGDADGLGSVRKKELVGAAEIFGIPPDFVEVTDDPELKDGMDTVWSPAKIEEIVLAEVLKKRIHTVLTFDEDGVSGHINHCAVANALANAAERGRLLQETGRPARLFQLQSTGVIRKFLGLLDIFMSASEKYLFLAPAGGFLAVWKAMQTHESQFVWYRRLFVATSRYTYINTFTEVKPSSKVMAALAVKNGKMFVDEEEEYSEDEMPERKGKGGSGKKGSGGGKEGGPKKRASKDDKVKSRTKTSSKKK